MYILRECFLKDCFLFKTPAPPLYAPGYAVSAPGVGVACAHSGTRQTFEAVRRRDYVKSLIQ